MYITGDTLVLLRDVGGGVSLASCEGVVGWIKKDGLDFQPSPGQQASGLVVPDTIVSSPTPPSKTVDLPRVDLAHDERLEEQDQDEQEGLLDATAANANGSVGSSPSEDMRRSSGPFDLGTPQYSPDIPHLERDEFFDPQASQHPRELLYQDTPEREQEYGNRNSGAGIRNSVLSTASSEALGGIGGFMMGMGGGVSELADTSIVEELAGECFSITCHR